MNEGCHLRTRVPDLDNTELDMSNPENSQTQRIWTGGTDLSSNPTSLISWHTPSPRPRGVTILHGRESATTVLELYPALPRSASPLVCFAVGPHPPWSVFETVVHGSVDSASRLAAAFPLARPSSVPPKWCHDAAQPHPLISWCCPESLRPVGAWVHVGASP